MKRTHLTLILLLSLGLIAVLALTLRSDPQPAGDGGSNPFSIAIVLGSEQPSTQIQRGPVIITHISGWWHVPEYQQQVDAYLMLERPTKGHAVTLPVWPALRKFEPSRRYRFSQPLHLVLDPGETIAVTRPDVVDGETPRYGVVLTGHLRF